MPKKTRKCRTCRRRTSSEFCSRFCQTAPKRRHDLTTSTHLVIPDTQVKAGVPNDHLVWVNRYIRDRYEGQPLTVVHLGDHWDMPSLSSYDRGKKAMEGRRYVEDVEAGNRAMRLLSEGLDWEGLRLVLLRGNHEERIVRAADDNAQVDGLVTLGDLESPGWEVHEFLEPVTIDGVVYAHYFYNPMTGRALGGQVATRLKTIGHSFTMGHQQTLDYALRFVNGHSQHGLVAGACYQHDEDYLGPQGNSQWRGIVVKNNVEDGSYDPMFVRLEYLCRRYEGHRLSEHQGVEL